MKKIFFLSFIIIALATIAVHAQLASTFAGTGSTGLVNDIGTNAAFNWPINIVFDMSKNLFVTDANNNVVRKITPTGSVTTFAGNGTAGVTNGVGIAARFNHPLGLAIDNVGNLYVTDARNNAIRKITPGGTVSLFAGSGLLGHADGPAATATFNYPNGITVDDSGNVYVADASNSMIRKITQAGMVSTLAGSIDSGYVDDTGAKAKFTYPSGIVADHNGNLFVADKSNNMIRKVTTAGVVTTYAGSPVAGANDDTGRAAGFASPYGITIDSSGNLYVAEIGNDLIRKITPTREVMTLMGLPGSVGAVDGTKDIATFDNPTGIALDGNGNLYVADWNNDDIRKIDLTYTAVFAPRKTASIQPFPNPAAGTVTIPAKAGDVVVIYNLIGAAIYNAPAVQDNPAIAVKDYAAGVYSVGVFAKSGTKKYGKFVKN
jgi:sugar lactone lactonase YvrE